MEIGGTDLVFSSSLSKEDASNCVRNYVARDWPEVVFENVEGEEPDMFIYENPDSKMAWDEGIEISYANMIYALFGEGEITLVHDRGTASESLALKLQLELLKLEVVLQNPCRSIVSNEGAV
jgi:hypothetical protein